MNQKSFKKAMLLCPKKYSLNKVFNDILKEFSNEVIEIDIRHYVKALEISINTQIFRFPNSIRRKWVGYYQNKINEHIMHDFLIHNPDLVFVYNSEMLLPSSVEKMKETAIVIFFLGDSPFFTPSNNFFLTLLSIGDMVLAPDSFWVQNLKMVGIKNSFFFIPGIDELSYHQNPPKELLQNVNETEILYCGMSYVNSWGYKKALLMSKFAKLKLEIYGDGSWKRWLPFFPELIPFFYESGFIPTPLLNAMFNKSKLMPVDGNPAVLNGFHIRTFEALGAGVLPLIEFRKDVEESVFAGLDIEIPIIKTYSNATELAERYLSDESLRLLSVSTLKQHVLSKYSSEKNADRILRFIRDTKK
jgi:hypothetical protein